MSTRRDRCGEAVLARLASSLVLVLLGWISVGCDKVQLPQVGQQPAAAAGAAAGGATPADVAPAVQAPNPAALPAVDAKPDAKAIVAAFLQKVATPGEIEDADLIKVTQVTEGLEQIQELNLAGSKVTDVGAATLSKFPKLVKVRLSGAPVTNAGIKVVNDMPELRVLSLGHTRVDDQGMATLAAHKGLRELVINNISLTDLGLKELENLDELEVLDISGTMIRGEGFIRFKGHKHLRVLHAQHTPLHNDALKYLANCPIEDLNVDVTSLSDVAMLSIGKMNKMQRLSMEFCSVTDAGINKMGLMKDLESISLRNNSGVSNLLFAKLQKCKNLKQVNVIGTRITASDVAKLVKLIPGVKVAI